MPPTWKEGILTNYTNLALRNSKKNTNILLATIN